jgi:hypothetical protein
MIFKIQTMKQNLLKTCVLGMSRSEAALRRDGSDVQ